MSDASHLSVQRDVAPAAQVVQERSTATPTTTADPVQTRDGVTYVWATAIVAPIVRIGGGYSGPFQAAALA